MNPEELRDLLEELKEQDHENLANLIAEARREYQAGDRKMAEIDHVLDEYEEFKELTGADRQAIRDLIDKQVWEF